MILFLGFVCVREWWTPKIKCQRLSRALTLLLSKHMAFDSLNFQQNDFDFFPPIRYTFGIRIVLTHSVCDCHFCRSLAPTYIALWNDVDKIWIVNNAKHLLPERI